MERPVERGQCHEGCWYKGCEGILAFGCVVMVCFVNWGNEAGADRGGVQVWRLFAVETLVGLGLIDAIEKKRQNYGSPICEGGN